MVRPVSKTLARLDPRDWGVEADGSTNDTAAYQAALNFAGLPSSESWDVVVPSGRSLVDGLTIPPGVSLIGMNDARIVTTGTILVQNSNGFAIEDVEIEASTGAAVSWMLRVENSTDFSIMRVSLYGNGANGKQKLTTGASAGLVIIGSSKGEVVDVQAQEFRGSWGIRLDSGNEDVVVERAHTTLTPRAGVTMGNTNTRCKFLECTVVDALYEFTVNDGCIDLYGPSNVDCVVDQCTVVGGGPADPTLFAAATGIRSNGGLGTQITNNVVRTAGGSFLTGISIGARSGINSTGTLIAENRLHIDVPVAYGLRSINPLEGTTVIVDNIFTGLGDVSNNALQIRRGAEYLKIHGNIIDLPGATGSPGIHLFPEAGVVYRYTHISDNTVVVNTQPIQARQVGTAHIVNNLLDSGAYAGSSAAVQADGSIIWVLNNTYEGSTALNTSITASVDSRNFHNSDS